MVLNKTIIYPKANQDLDDILKYISIVLANPTAADKLIVEIFEAIKRLSDFPLSCPLIENKNIKDQSLRKLIVKKYIIFYRIKRNEIQVVRVLNGMSNYEKVL